MTALTALWLPILLSAVIVFIASSLIHMVSPWHKGDYPKLANEDAVLDALRPLAIPPGDYLLPRPMGREEMKSGAFHEKVKRGPVLMMTVMPNGMMAMGRTMMQWFVYLVVVAIFAGYITSHALAPGAPYLAVFRFIGATAFIAHAAAFWPMSIWYHRGWNITVKATIDGLVYALLTAGVFGWLWPR